MKLLPDYLRMIIRRKLQLILGLQIHPELRGGSKEARKAQCGFGRDSTAAMKDRCYTTQGDVEF
ncbi:MAG: hypothetical protein NVS1B14_06290 [Vulcanimicrobiaceae bacterium]